MTLVLHWRRLGGCFAFPSLPRHPAPDRLSRPGRRRRPLGSTRPGLSPNSVTLGYYPGPVTMGLLSRSRGGRCGVLPLDGMQLTVRRRRRPALRAGPAVCVCARRAAGPAAKGYFGARSGGAARSDAVTSADARVGRWRRWKGWLARSGADAEPFPGVVFYWTEKRPNDRYSDQQK